MNKSSEYRQNAQRCRALAAKAGSADEREGLLDMARHWEALAEDRANLVGRHPELDQGPKNDPEP